jgi:hypothetical protein
VLLRNPLPENITVEQIAANPSPFFLDALSLVLERQFPSIPVITRPQSPGFY